MTPGQINPAETMGSLALIEGRTNDAWAFAPALLEEHDRMAAYARRLLADGDQA